jgi:hypothetical protein
MAPANTGSESRSKMVVIKMDHTNKGIESNDSTLDRILEMVVMKLIDPRMEETPARWRLKMARSTDLPE